MKLRGQTIKVGKKEYVLKDQLGEGGFSTIFQTNYPQIICKAQVLMNSQMLKAYNREKQILKNISHANIVKLYDTYEMEGKDNKYGFLFMQKCSNGTAFDILEKNQGGFVHQKIVIDILLVIADILQLLHSKGIAHRDIKMENILLNSKKQYKLCDFGSCSKNHFKKIDASNRVEIEQYIQKTTTPLYRSPQQLDLYSGFQIGVKVDIFALGVLAFMMCFQKPPFQSRLSAINKQYFLPQDHSYSKELVSFIQRCFITNPIDRPSASEVKQQLRQLSKAKKVQISLNINTQYLQVLKQFSYVNEGNIKKNDTIAETGFIDRIKRFYNQLTTQTQGWIAGFVEDSEQAPMLKYNRSIISKCYEKKYKIQKVYQLIDKYSQQYRGKCLVTLKLLILLHNFLRKGPVQAIIYQKSNSPLQFCVKEFKLWKTGMKTSDEQDFKRNTFVCILIRSYCLILIKKIKFCYENSHLIEANYSIVPYLSKLKENTILKLGFIQSMMQFLSNCLDFHQNVQRIHYLDQIQKTIILSMIDQEYCLISTLTFIISAFKMAVCYVKQDIDFVGLQAKVQQVQNGFEKIYKRMAKLLQSAQRQDIMLENSNISLKMDVISYIKNIKIEKKTGKFNVTDHLNYKNSIYGLKIPLAYQEVVKNPDFLKDIQQQSENNKAVVQVNQFKVSKQPLKQVQKQEKVQKKSLNTSTKVQSKRVSQKQGKKNSFSPPQQMPNKQQSPIDSKTSQKKKIQNNTNETQATIFSKPKNPKQKIFQNFTFQQKKPQKSKIKQTPNNMMQFTHQNLNKDFFSINTVVKQQKNDQFNDFFSIVQKKYEKQKIIKKNNQTQQKPIINSNTSKQVFLSQNKPDINKIQLINFFCDDQEHQKGQDKGKNKVQVQEKKESKVSQSANLLQFQENNASATIVNKKVEKQVLAKVQEEDQFVISNPSEQPIKAQSRQPEKSQSKQQSKIQQKPKQQKSMIKDEKSQRSSPLKEENLIDLRQFVVQQVKRNAQQYIIDYSTLIFKQNIGYGNSSQVFKGQWRGREVAIKKIKDNLSRSQKQFKRQIMTSVKIRHHPQLVTLIGVCQHQKYFYIINQYCNGSTLFDLLHQSNQNIPWHSRINLAKQIARGMIFLHTNDPPIIHRDLKSLNVLLMNKYDSSNPDLAQLKIADFGLSRDYASTYMTGTLGTYHWMAPQIFNNEPYTLKADVYSYGIVLWQIASRVPPYTNMKNPHSLMKFVTIENGRPQLSYLDKECPYQWRMLMIRCWDKFPSNRPTFTQILSCLQYLSK